MNFRFTLAGVLNGIALALIFPVSVSTLLSLKFYIVIALLAGAVTAAEYKGAERAKKGEL